MTQLRIGQRVYWRAGFTGELCGGTIVHGPGVLLVQGKMTPHWMVAVDCEGEAVQGLWMTSDKFLLLPEDIRT